MIQDNIRKISASNRYEWSQSNRKVIFADFEVSTKIECPLDEIIKECYLLRDEMPSVDISNKGGYQSPMSPHFTRELPVLDKLQSTILQYSLAEVQEAGFKLKMNRSVFWVNINQDTNYNVIHTHGRTDVIGLFYVKVPKNSGNFCIMRNDGMTYTTLNANENPTFANYYQFPPKESHFYMFPGHVWHHVDPNNSQEERISISYNIGFQ